MDTLWIVLDDKHRCLWYGRGTQNLAVQSAKLSPDYEPPTTLYLYAIDCTIAIKS